MNNNRFITSIKRGLLAALAALALAATPTLQAGSIATNVVAGTPLLLLSSGAYAIDSVVFFNTNAATVANLWFYDSGTTNTNYIRAATSTYTLGNVTNTTTFTNSSGIVITNIAYAIGRVTNAVTLATNERPRLLPMIVPAADALTVTSPTLVPSRGLLVYSTASGLINLTYEPIR